MRYLNAMGQIGWKASPAMLQKLADAEREVRTIWRDSCHEAFGDCELEILTPDVRVLGQ